MNNTNILKNEIITNCFKANLHFGHISNKWNPKMFPYLLYTKYGYHIFDLLKTSKLLTLAGNIVEKKAQKNGTILFVGTNSLTSSSIEKHAENSNSYYINYRWLGGLLTNWSTIQKRVNQLKKLEKEELNGTFELLSKKDYSKQKQKLKKLKKLFAGIKNMATLPDIIIFTNPMKEKNAFKECFLLGIPAISIIDSNCDPDLVPYPIPANDDSLISVDFILNYLVKRIIKGYEKSNLNII